jgi:hypothetical protein
MPKKHTFPADPLERCHLRWHGLFFGVWRALCRRDPRLITGLLLALKRNGLADYHGDVLTFNPEVFERNPSHGVLEKAERFRSTAEFPRLKGKIRFGHTRPPYLLILLDYYRALYEERSKLSPKRQRGEEAANERALKVAAEKAGCTVSTCRKHLEQAQKLYPDLTKLWSRKGAEWVRSS